VIHVVRGDHAARKDHQMKTQNQASTTTEAAAVAAQGAPVAPKKVSSTKDASRKKGATKAKKGGKVAVTKKSPAKVAAKASSTKVSGKGRANSKKTAVLDLLRRKDGATLGEIAKATGWQNHSIRGFISGTVGKRMGLKVESSKSASGERTYKIAGK
jgi:hypothetical protein